MTCIFLTTTVIQATRELMAEGIIGQITTPGQGNVVPGTVWGADNECYLDNYRGDEPYLAWLEKQRDAHPDNLSWCRFASAPDVPGQWAPTIANLQPMASRIRDLGYPATLVAQDGMTVDWGDWDQIDALFLGGSNAFKLGPTCRAIVREAKRRGMWVHMGRVNSFRRFQYANDIGCDSADGTLIAFQPDVNIPKMRRWYDALRHPTLDGIDIDAVGRSDTFVEANVTMPAVKSDATPAGARRLAAEAQEEAARLAAMEDPEQMHLFSDDEVERPTRVLLYSGGQDSYCIRHLWKPDVLLYVDMGTGYTADERALLSDDVEVVHLDLSRWELDDKIIPLRNLFLVMAAAQYGGLEGHVQICLGATAGDRPHDKGHEFAAGATEFLSYLWGAGQDWTPKGKKVEVVVPFKDLSKGQLVAAYLEAGGDVDRLLTESFSCYTGGEPCGACQACARRWAAFACNGITSTPDAYDYVLENMLPRIQDGTVVRDQENDDILRALDWASGQQPTTTTTQETA